MVDAMDLNPYSFALGILYLAGSFPLTFGLYMKSSVVFKEPFSGARGNLLRALLVFSLISFPVLMFVGGIKLMYNTGAEWSDFSPALLPLYSLLFLTATKFTAR